MRVTFDSNVYRPIVCPAKFPRDRRQADLLLIHESLKDGFLEGFLCESIVALEGVRGVDRGDYFSAATLKYVFTERESDDGSLKLTAAVGPPNQGHPGMPSKFGGWVQDALNLGLKLMRAPRVGMSRPAEVSDAWFAPGPHEPDSLNRAQRFGGLTREIEKRGVGFAILKALGQRMNARLGVVGHWTTSLDCPENDEEARELIRAVSEWADGDVVAAHYSYGNDVLCTEDKGRSAEGSIFSDDSRRWLEDTYGLSFLTVNELAEKCRRPAGT